MNLLRRFQKQKKGVKIATFLSVFVFLAAAKIAFSQAPTPADIGEFKGFGWMATGIANPNTSEGGGGWLRFNCLPNECQIPPGYLNAGAPNVWGTRVNFDSTSPTYGYLSGQAWSSNYGWMTFDEDIVSSCWANNPSETAPTTARILLNNPGQVKNFVGWAKFVAGDDFPSGGSNDDGWDGCVSFDGVDYGVQVDSATGQVTGWGWGSDVVGWLSFQNPECPFCDTTIVFPITGCMNPMALNYNPSATIPGTCIFMQGEIYGCTDSTAANYNSAATIDDGSCYYDPTVDLVLITNFPGNTLPVGSATSTEYNVSPRWTFTNPTQVGSPFCTGEFRDQNGTVQNLLAWTGGGLARPSATTLPPWDVGPYSGVTNVSSFAASPSIVDGSIFTYKITCTDINGNPFSDTATVVFDDNRINNDPVLTLQVTPDVFVLGNPPSSYSVGPITWSATNYNQIQPNSCVGYVAKNGMTIMSLPGWTGITLANPSPTATINGPLNGLASEVPTMSSGEYFRFAVRCQKISGGFVQGTDVINITDAGGPGVEPPLIWLHITNPDADSTTPNHLLRETISAWNPATSSGGAMVTLQWDALNMVTGSCVADSQMYSGSTTTVIGSHPSWNGQTLSDGSVDSQVLDVTNASVINNTKFQISCEPLNAPGTIVSAQVCMGVDGRTFPGSACSAGSSTKPPPGYKEI